MGLKSLILFAGAAAAHFGLPYPEWRGDTLETDGTDFNQRMYPCANVPPNSGNTTTWPLTGGSLKLDLHHPWTYLFINLGLGTNVTNFNVTLTPQFWNSTGNGTLCIPKLPLPADLSVSDGDDASIQIVTVGHNGAALYNCADIRFAEDAETLSGDECQTSDNVSYYVLAETENPETSQGEVPPPSGGGASSSEDGEDGEEDGGEDGGDGGSGAMGRDVPVFALTAAVGLAFTFAAGLSL